MPKTPQELLGCLFCIALMWALVWNVRGFFRSIPEAREDLRRLREQRRRRKSARRD